MSASFLFILIIEVCLILLVASFLYVFITKDKVAELNKRFDSYSISSTDDKYQSYFDRFFIKLDKFIDKISSILSKSEVLKKYGRMYDKYTNYSELGIKKGIDYVSIKFLISFLFTILYTISSIMRYRFDFMAFIFAFLFCFFLIDVYYKIDFNNKRKQIENDLLSAIIIMNNAFKSGMNVMQAVDIVKSELSGPIRDEFTKISIDIKYGLSIEEVFDRFYNRVNIEDIKYISSSLSLINKNGGNIVRVFNSIEKNFYNKKKIKDELKSLTSSSIFMFRILAIMPFLLILAMLVINPSYFKPLITNTLGRLIIFTIFILYGLYIIVIKKVLKVKL